MSGTTCRGGGPRDPYDLVHATGRIDVAPAKPRFIPAELGKSLLLQYSEWLDVSKIVLSEPDPPTHAELVDTFLAERNPLAVPMLEE